MYAVIEIWFFFFFLFFCLDFPEKKLRNIGKKDLKLLPKSVFWNFFVIVFCEEEKPNYLFSYLLSISVSQSNIPGRNLSICYIVWSEKVINERQYLKLLVLVGCCQTCPTTPKLAYVLQVHFVSLKSIPAGNDMFKVNKRNTRTRCEICSKLTIKTPIAPDCK